jgi:hypothetical protein
VYHAIGRDEEAHRSLQGGLQASHLIPQGAFHRQGCQGDRFATRWHHTLHHRHIAVRTLRQHGAHHARTNLCKPRGKIKSLFILFLPFTRYLPRSLTCTAWLVSTPSHVTPHHNTHFIHEFITTSPHITSPQNTHHTRHTSRCKPKRPWKLTPDTL